MTDEVLGSLSGEPRDDRLSDQLRLPRGAFITMRQSGGLHFTSREVLVYRNGRVTYESTSKERASGTRRITTQQVAVLQQMLEQSGFFNLPPTGGQPNPDAHTYEILARARRKTKYVEVFEGSIPAELKPLIEQLQRLMRPDETSEG